MDRYFIEPSGPDAYYVFDRQRGHGESGGGRLATGRALAQCRDPELAQLIADMLNQRAAAAAARNVKGVPV